jgi:acyl-CoA synthetase (AMP-forming)/AMP-acid ligase II
MEGRTTMIFRSPYPDIAIPETPLTPFVLRHAARLADKPALIDGPTGRVLTYRQLADDVERAAAGLAQLGFRKGDVFGILAPNSLEYVVAFHAIASIGGVAAPINPTYTVAETAHHLRDMGAICLFTTPELLDRATELANSTDIREIIVFGEAPGATPFASLLESDGPLPCVTIDPRTDVVAILCSSGTTGLPKGVQLTHDWFVASACQFAVMGEINEDDVLPGHLPFFHAFGLIVSVTHGLAMGATSVLLPRFELVQFLQLVQDYRATRAYLVPPMVLALAKQPIVDRFDLSTLKTIGCAAAPLSQEIARACCERLGCRIKQLYGMTETGITHMSPDDLEWSKLGTVGPCAPHCECKIVDTVTGTELGPDQQGEIWMRGPVRMKGYLNRPEATAQLIDAEGWAHSGDVGFVDADGYLTVVDRLKEMIKYKGLQIAPAELEAVLLTHPAVADSAVIPSPNDEAGEVPKAFVVLKEEATVEELMGFVAARVAPYKKVRRLEFVEMIPKSPSGKILRRILVERERAALLTLV